MLLSELLGTRVVSRDTAETLGDVHDVVVDASTRKITALQLGKGRKARLVDWASLSGVGPDAVVASSGSALRDGGNDREQRTIKGDIPLLGATVLTDHGDAAGSVSDVDLDEATGVLTALLVDGEPIDSGRLRAVGGYAVVVTADPSS